MSSSLKHYAKQLLLVPYRDTRTNEIVRPIWTLETLGSEYGGWTIPTQGLSPQSVCYCVGVGEDITFDLELIRRFGCQVFAYDPTPRAIEHVRKVAANLALYHFAPFGVWDKDEAVRFFAPSNPAHVSHSALNLQRTDAYFDADCRRLATLLRENGHTAVDLLKLDVEGAEYRVIASILADGLDIGTICVEFDEVYSPLDDGYAQRMKKTIADLTANGYTLVAVNGGNYTFVLRSRIPRLASLTSHSIGSLAAAVRKTT